MSKFDPRFWEILLLPDKLDNYSQEEVIWHETEVERELRYKREDKKRVWKNAAGSGTRARYITPRCDSAYLWNTPPREADRRGIRRRNKEDKENL